MFLNTAAPRSLTIFSGPDGSTFQRHALRYQKILAREGVALKILPSEGSSDNLKRLADAKAEIDIGFVLGGEAREAKFENLVSLGSVALQPLLVFHSGEPRQLLSEFKGRRINVGPPGSGTQTLALALLKANGIVAGDGTTIDQTDLEDPARELRDGKVDVVFLMSESTATTVMRNLMRDAGVHLFNFAQADGYVRRINTLSKLHLPRGTLDFGKDIPPHDVSLIGPTVQLVARESLHPALSDLLLEAAREVHGSPGLYRKRGEFPAAHEGEFRMSPDATRYYASGKSFLYRTFPFWMASLIARVLAVAHAQGVIHRDLKPENVIQTPSGIVKVLDFGLARQDGSSGQRLTQSGTVVGTPGYMAPEQILGEHLDFRADLFALGVLLYELVSGTNPFEGSTYGVTVDRILRNDPPPLVTSAHQPSALAPVVARCLAKDPKDRYASTPALVTDLELVHMASGVHATPGAGSKRASTSARNRRPPPTRWWWEFHQVSISVIYVLLMFPIWHVRSWLPRPWGGVVLFAALACAALATSLRLHLTFTARVYPGELATQRAWARPWTRGCDVGLAAMLLLAALAIGAAHQAWATLLVTMAIVTLVASLVIEPATTKAAFTRRSATMRARNDPP